MKVKTAAQGSVNECAHREMAVKEKYQRSWLGRMLHVNLPNTRFRFRLVL